MNRRVHVHGHARRTVHLRSSLLYIEMHERLVYGYTVRGFIVYTMLLEYT